MSQDDSYSPGGIGASDPEAFSLFSPRVLRGESSIVLPRLPTFGEIAAVDAAVQLAPRRTTRQPSLFESMLSPEHILQSAQEDPTRYDERALSLLRAMYSKMTDYQSLTSAERDLIDTASVEFFSTPKPKPEPVVAAVPKKEKPSIIDGDKTPTPEPIEGPVMDAFWWT